jgi:hypothetical protein
VNVEEVLLDELVEDGAGRHAEAALALEVVDIFRRDVGEVADAEEGVVGVGDVGGRAWDVIDVREGVEGGGVLGGEGRREGWGRHEVVGWCWRVVVEWFWRVVPVRHVFGLGLLL